MSETVQVGDAADLICNLKAAVTALECQYKMNLEEQQALRKEEKPRKPPMFMMIPLEQKRKSDDSTTCEGKPRVKRRNRRRRSSDDYACSVTSSDYRNTSIHRRDECDETKGPTMRGGILHGRCGCLHRDGLQDYCPLTECRGQPECMTKPWATCPPARYYRAQYPDIWPPAATDSITF